MRAVLPGKAQAKLQAVCTGYWESRRLIAYITGNAFVILTGADIILQTIYDDDDTHLGGIAFDEASGKIAICAGSSVRIYKPYGQWEDALKWSLQHNISLEESEPEDAVTTLSWGPSEELLVGSSWLTLYSTDNAPEAIWRKYLANTVKFANFSYDSAYIASTGNHDRLVKIWRRLSYGSDDVRFDFTYLPHPSTVTDMHWRRPFHIDQTIDNVLYTFCADNILRIWAATDPHALQILQLWAQIDLGESIQPRGLALKETSQIRFAFIVDGKDFTLATEHAVQARSTDKSTEDYALTHLIEVANRNPEICVVMDELGHLSAWGLENVGCKNRQTSNIFNITHVDGLDLNLPKALDSDISYVQFYNYCNKTSGKLEVLAHHFDGKIEVFQSDVADLFDPSPRSSRFDFKAIWTGHSAAVKKIVRNVSGSAVVTRTEDNESIVWRHVDNESGSSLLRQSIIPQQDHIHRICVMRKGKFVVLLHQNSLTLWDTRTELGTQLAECHFEITGKPLCILMLPEVEKGGSLAHVATITSNMKGIVWEVCLPTSDRHSKENRHRKPSVREYCRIDLGEADDLAYVLPVDPAGSPPVVSGFLDTFARDIAISYTHTGLLRSWTARIDTVAEKVDWLQTCSVNTGISEPALASASSIRKAALVNSSRSELTIWDVRGSQLEFSESYEDKDTIRDLDWTSTPDDQSILGVGFGHRVLLLAQMRYDYLNKGPAWAAIREINIRDLTPHPIGDSTWLSGGNLIIGAGNQLLVYDKEFEPSASALTSFTIPHKKGPWDLFEIVTRLNGPLPVYHPQFLGQCTLAGKSALIQHILLALYKVLKYFIEGDQIDTHLGISLDAFYTPDSVSSTSTHKGGKAAFDTFSDDEDVETVTETVASAINEKLTQIALPQLSRQEQIHLADIVECVAIVEKQRRSMDDNAARFMLFFRQHALHRGRANEVNLSWREINWAYHSNSQDILVGMVSSQFHGRMLWNHARESGMFMWMTDSTALKAQFEVIARNEYTKSDMKNPIDCTLFYLALKKKTVLQGLWRMAGWNREQAATSKLLANNFQDPKWRTAALKNAYALLGKRRFEYAAAFFLLADCLKDAVNVILNQLKDLQLAIAVTRVYEGETGPVLKELIEEKVLPLASQEGNRWLASWAFWMLHRRDMAVRALISPVYTLLETPQAPDMQSKLFLTDDPALVVLYSQLRQKTLQTLRGASKVTPKVEWTFVLHNARLYDRMGCDLLALDLVRNWEFLLPAPTSVPELGGEPDPRKLLRRRSSLVVADLPIRSDIKLGSGISIGGGSGSGGAAGAASHKPPPSVFEEPESNSLLDSFGF
ncbi:WD repeat-containing protein [Phlyctema vagabunda]|uniref:WD repeat-containing protein n=1 Tax=Phlyctema vagabunda TaxID=108571 RepID=A0ABR4PCL6_9HELO